MQRSDRWPDDYDPEGGGSRAGSRRNSSSMSRRNSIKKEKEVKKRETSSTNTTPKRVAKPQNPDFVVTGKQILKRSDRANSLPGAYHRRPSVESITKKRTFESPKRVDRPANQSQSSKSRETSLEDDVSLDLSQVSDFEDTNSKYGIKQKSVPLATSTPKLCPKNFQKPRSGSLQSQMHSQKMETMRRGQKSFDSSKPSRDSTFCSRDSLYKTSSTASPYARCGTELDYSSVSPEYSGQSSADLSPRPSHRTEMAASHSQDLHFSSCCGSSWQDCSEMGTKVEEFRHSDGEWNSFWANYNNSVSKVPLKTYYDQCPTPYRTENIDLADFEFSDCSMKRSPEEIKNLNSIIRNEGLHLTPRETQNIIKCAHILGTVLTRAIDRRSKETDDNQATRVQELNKEDEERENKKRQMTLNLQETASPLDAKEEARNEVTTQTDISLPNTKSAPKIFENILRQLSKTSLEDGAEKLTENDKNIAKAEDSRALTAPP